MLSWLKNRCDSRSQHKHRVYRDMSMQYILPEKVREFSLVEKRCSTYKWACTIAKRKRMLRGAVLHFRKSTSECYQCLERDWIGCAMPIISARNESAFRCKGNEICLSWIYISQSRDNIRYVLRRVHNLMAFLKFVQRNPYYRHGR